MSSTKDSSADKLDALLKETRASNRMATWQLGVSLAALIPGIVAALAQSGSTVVVIAFVVPIALVLVFVAVYPTNSSGNGSWYNWVVSREKLRLQDIQAEKHLGTTSFHDLYLTSLRMHYQFALLEGRKELAEYLKQELEKETRPAAVS